MDDVNSQGKQTVGRVKVCQGHKCGKAPDGYSYFFCKECETEVPNNLLEKIRRAYNADDGKVLRALMTRAATDLLAKREGLCRKKRKNRKKR